MHDYQDALKDQAVLIDFYENAKICTIDSYNDLIKLFGLYNGDDNIFPRLNFEIMSKDYDVIHLTQKGQIKTRLTHPHNLYGWDAESCLIMNFDVIKIDKYIKVMDVIKEYANLK